MIVVQGDDEWCELLVSKRKKDRCDDGDKRNVARRDGVGYGTVSGEGRGEKSEPLGGKCGNGEAANADVGAMSELCA